MVKVFAKNVGGSTVEIEVSSLSDVRNALNNSKATATVNGRPVASDYAPQAGDFIVLSEMTKGNKATEIYKSKDLSIVVMEDKTNKVYIINGQQIPKAQALKMAKAILVADGYDVE